MPFANMDVVAILYDKNDNAIAASKTVVAKIGGESSQVVYFTWPQTILKADVRTIEVIPRFNVFASEKI